MDIFEKNKQEPLRVAYPHKIRTLNAEESELKQIEFAIEQTKRSYLLGTGGMKEILRKLNARKDEIMGVGL